MEIQGVVQNGVVVFAGQVPFPDGTKVAVAVCDNSVNRDAPERQRVEFPIFYSDAPGTIDLTNERIAEILDDEDIESVNRSWNVPS